MTFHSHKPLFPKITRITKSTQRLAALAASQKTLSTPNAPSMIIGIVPFIMMEESRYIWMKRTSWKLEVWYGLLSSKHFNSFVDGPSDIIFGTHVVRSLLLINICQIVNTSIGFCFKETFVQGVQ